MKNTPLFPILIIIFLVLGLFSIRINTMKGKLTKKQIEQYTAKIKLIKKITVIALALFFLSIAVLLILQFGYGVVFEIGGSAFLLLIFGLSFLVASTLFHYIVLVKIMKKF